MHILDFLEFCVGASFDLWPSYIIELLLLKESSPHNISKLAAFFYGHDVPLRMASRVYTICNPNRTSGHVVAWVMGGYYATFYTQCNSRHMAVYFDVKHGQILWINGRNHSQLEPILPSDQTAPYLDCRTLRQSMPALTADAVRSHMYDLCNEAAFNILDV
jgi:hypothetical protein